ncbi:hypothetical protein E2C01_002288 [Portunus trituberculatus]|uniref:Uncharacterized protein n=1 Tax=Portunus trituberculatus TaxID=210409 RepID=A0A5B7CJ02_PORTR|nr:hypothetical protein [Portunus trituberculatus]
MVNISNVTGSKEEGETLLWTAGTSTFPVMYWKNARVFPQDTACMVIPFCRAFEKDAINPFKYWNAFLP